MITANKLIILLLSIFSIFLLSLTFFIDDSSELYKLISYYDFGLCFFFLYDFFKQLREENNKLKYFFTIGWLDFLSSVPVVAEFRFLRVFRVFRVIKIIRSTRKLLEFLTTNKKESFFSFIIFIVIVSIIATSSGVLYVEHEVGNIKTAENTLWWTFVTITTVGYGDFYPVTPEGKILSVILITTGIAAFGAIISYITDKVNSIKE
ncbi:MAG: potassium channel family protein [Bacteroidota bacterium]